MTTEQMLSTDDGPTAGALGAPPAATEGVTPTASTSRALRLSRATKRFGDQTVFSGLDLTVPNGSFTVLVGPSGCGKSTCLRAVAGLEPINDGRILLDDLDVTDQAARERGLAMVFQDFALYPHMTVQENITFGLRLQARRRRAVIAREEITARCAEVVEMLALPGLEQRYPHQLSGGQRQRVALARAVVRRPAAFLMDEPLSNLDAQLRGRTRTELVRLHRRLATTFLYVTHDQVEALSMATRLVVMDRGVVAQQGTPEEVHDRPATVFVATFIGSPPMNTMRVEGHARGAGTAVQGPGLCGGLGRALHEREITLGWRPATGRLVEPDSPTAEDGILVTGRVDVIENLGETVQVTALPDGGTGSWTVTLPRGSRPQPGSVIAVRVPEADLHCFEVMSGERA